MFQSLQSRILLLVVGVLFLMTVVLTCLVQKETSNAMLAAQEENAKNVLHTVFLNVLNQHRSIVFYKEAMLERRQAELKNIISIALKEVQYFYNEAREGRISESDAKDLAKEVIRSFRYDHGTGYLWITNTEKPLPRVVMHAFNRELAGIIPDDLRFYHTKNGKHHVAAMVDVCLESGSGFVEYQWERPRAGGITGLHPKVSYVEYFKPWDWVVGTGVYIDDIETEANRRMGAVIEELKEGLSKVEFFETGYVFILGGDKKMVIHPTIPRGTDVSETINHATGEYLFDDIVNALKTPEKSLRYLRPGSGDCSLLWKKSYVFYFEPMDWYICSSVYEEEIKAPARNLTSKIFFFSGVMLVLAILLSVFYSRSVIRPLRMLSLSVKDIEEIGDADIPVGGTIETKNLGMVLKNTLETLSRSKKMLMGRTLELEKRTFDLELANKQLQQWHHTFLTVLDSIDAAVYVSDLNSYEILFMNRHIKDLLGADYTGQQCWKVLYDENKPCSHCIQGKLLTADGVPAGAHHWERQSMKTNRWYMNSDRVIEWVDGRYVHIQVAMDITKVKALETEKLKTEILLRQAQKMEAIGTLAGGIAHDFNNILSPIIGYVEIMLYDMAREYHARDRDRLQKVLSAANRAKALVMQILNFSRKSDDAPKLLQVQSILKEVLTLVSATLPSTIEIHQEISENCSSVMADPSKIHQIAMNLITNAYHAMEDTPGGRLTVTLKDIALAQSDVEFMGISPGTYVCLQISDTGIGMDKRTVDRIFDPYFTTKNMGKGTGLGLAVTHGIVAKCGGGIAVESEPGKGSIFSIYFPVGEQINDIREGAVVNEIRGGTETVLLVDDEPSVVELQQQMLKSLGYRFDAKTSSLETLALFRKHPLKYDLLITDMTMPQLTGDKLAEEVIRIRPDMPVIICSGLKEKINEEKTKIIGAKAFLMKPFSRNELACAIRSVLASNVTVARS